MFHYTYRITNLIENKHYYGSRTCNCQPIKDIGIKYFSSSSDKEFIIDQRLNSEKYKYKVIKTFKTRKEAIQFEIKLHNKLNVAVNESFYNKCKQKSDGFDTTGVKNTQRQKKLNSKNNSGVNNAMFGISVYEVWVEKYGQEEADELKERMFVKRSKTVSGKNNPNYGNHWTEEQKLSMSNKKKGTKFKNVICPFCGKEDGGPNMTRYHFDNCKNKT